jgi:hypothetical protein
MFWLLGHEIPETHDADTGEKFEASTLLALGSVCYSDIIKE